MSEEDFHKLLNSELGVTKALMQGRIRVEGGFSGVTSAKGLVADFVMPYLIDTWQDAKAKMEEAGVVDKDAENVLNPDNIKGGKI